MSWVSCLLGVAVFHAVRRLCAEFLVGLALLSFRRSESCVLIPVSGVSVLVGLALRQCPELCTKARAPSQQTQHWFQYDI